MPFYLTNIKHTENTVIGNCPTCNNEIGYHFGSNADEYPINASYASYSHRHIACACGTTFKDTAVISIPQNIDNMPDWFNDFRKENADEEKLYEEVCLAIPNFLESYLLNTKPKGKYWIAIDKNTKTVQMFEDQLLIYTWCGLLHTTPYYFSELFYDPKKNKYNYGTIFNIEKTLKTGKIYLNFSSSYFKVDVSDEIAEKRRKIAHNKAWKLLSKYIGKNITFTYKAPARIILID
jgi:hypothetical protein